ncbi:menaquinone biosynthesis decarboxylase [Anaerosolibacter sp.]|uniref:menaquinone biosynthesis decarboxylase n=1 Tax=Anaerosolibacter sp. TaxID=1872527 RepID=UPI0039EF6F69
MSYKDLQDFVKRLEDIGQLKRVPVEVDRNLEITEIVDRVSKAYGPAILFENVKDSPYPVLINAFGTYERTNMALEVNDINKIAQEIENLMDMSSGITFVNKVKSVPKLARLAQISPKKITKAVCQEVIEEPDLTKLPILKCWPEDGGPFITLPLVITKDPETGMQNMGMYRLQVYDEKTTGMHWHLHKDGRRIYEKYRVLGGKMPVAVAIGCDPATIYSAAAPLPKEVDEMIFAGFLRKSPLEIVKCVTNDLFVPANAEFILEGYVDIDELRVEGPFGDHTGYYSVRDLFPVFHVKKITRKRNPIYPATVVGKPPMEDCYLGKVTERILLPMVKLHIPEIIEMNFPIEGVFHNCVIVSIKKSYPGQAKKVMHAMWGMGKMMYTKMIIVVDEHVNPHDLSTVAWKVFNNIDAAGDIVIVEGPLDALDHASNLPRYGHKMGIDATKKWSTEGHTREWPNDIEMLKEIKDMVSERWEQYGI